MCYSELYISAMITSAVVVENLQENEIVITFMVVTVVKYIFLCIQVILGPNSGLRDSNLQHRMRYRQTLAPTLAVLVINAQTQDRGRNIYSISCLPKHKACFL